MSDSIDSAELRLEAMRIFVTGAEIRDGVLHCPNANTVRALLAARIGVSQGDSRLRVVVRQVRELLGEAARTGAYRR